jgi:predicted nucleic acid-binding protein
MAFLLDSNIIIYSFSIEFQYLRELIISETCTISEISRVEVLGYHGLKEKEDKYFRDIFDYVPLILPDQIIFDQAIIIRKKYNLKLGDSLIAATAIVNGLEVCTRNISDFERVKGLKSFNPVS